MLFDVAEGSEDAIRIIIFDVPRRRSGTCLNQEKESPSTEDQKDVAIP
jgi:hypothetical protein